MLSFIQVGKRGCLWRKLKLKQKLGKIDNEICGKDVTESFGPTKKQVQCTYVWTFALTSINKLLGWPRKGYKPCKKRSVLHLPSWQWLRRKYRVRPNGFEHMLLAIWKQRGKRYESRTFIEPVSKPSLHHIHRAPWPCGQQLPPRTWKYKLRPQNNVFCAWWCKKNL